MGPDELLEKLDAIADDMEGSAYHWDNGCAPAVRQAASDLAAARAEIGRLREAMKEAMAHWDLGEDPHWVLAGIRDILGGE